MNINELIQILNRAKETVGGETEVAICNEHRDCVYIEDIVIQGCKSLMGKNSSDEDTKLYIVYGW